VHHQYDPCIVAWLCTFDMEIKIVIGRQHEAVFAMPVLKQRIVSDSSQGLLVQQAVQMTC
jgi:hypothetical protein